MVLIYALKDVTREAVFLTLCHHVLSWAESSWGLSLLALGASTPIVCMRGRIKSHGGQIRGVRGSGGRRRIICMVGGASIAVGGGGSSNT